MSSVRDTVITTMQSAGLGSYASQAGPVITALENRESEIVDNLISFASENGMDKATSLRALNDCGLTVSPQAVDGVSEDPRIAAMEATMAEVQAALRSLRGE